MTCSGRTDGILHGRPEHVWPLIADYRRYMEETCGLTFNMSKSRCWSPAGNYGDRPADFPLPLHFSRAWSKR